MSAERQRVQPAIVWSLGLACVAALASFPLWLPWLAFRGLGERTPPTFEREPSPDGRFEVVREQCSGFLDAYERLWLAPAGELDAAKWTAIAPEVDGSWGTEWWSPTHLVLTDHGAFPEQRRPCRDQQVDGVRVETRPAPEGRFVDSPDGRFHVALWTYEDSRGRRTAARLDSTWQNETHCSQQLVPEGPWQVDVQWLRADRLQLRVTPAAGAAMPAVPPAACAITVETVRG